MQLLFPQHYGTLSPAGVADAFTWPDTDRPFLRAIMVSTADGAARSPKGLSGGISSAADRLVFATVRGLSDVILVGAETVRSEGYRAPRPRPELADRRQAASQAPTPRLAIITRSGDLDIAGSLFSEAAEPPLIYVPATMADERRTSLATVAEVVVAGDEDVAAPLVVADLSARGLNRVACEGGPSILGQFVAHRLIDELCLTITPLLYGGTSSESPVTRIIAGLPLDDSPRPMRLAHIIESDGTLFLRYAAPL